MMMAAARERRLQHTGNLAKEFRRVHFVGIGGSGMSGIAEVLCTLGYEVSGSDNADNAATRRLASLGARVMRGHNASNVLGTDCVVVSSAIKHDNPELMEARSQRIPIVPRAAMLAELMRFRRGIAVAGTHGKTTTASLLATTLHRMGATPGFMIGGLVEAFGSNFHVSDGPYFVVEGDEYDTAFFNKVSKFQHYRPNSAILTSIEFDHADIFADLAAIKRSFAEFIGRIPVRGALVAHLDDPVVAELAREARCPVIGYGLADGYEWRYDDFEPRGLASEFSVFRRGQLQGRCRLPMPGRHNALNALAVIALLTRLGFPFASIAAGLGSFEGVKRRQQVRGVAGGVTVVDDFAHHPTAVRETLQALRLAWPDSRLVVVFEPRTNSSRRAVFQDDYAGVFGDADRTLIRAHVPLDTVPADEQFSSARLAGDLRARGLQAEACADTDAILDALAGSCRSGDVVAILSNGGFDNIHERLLARLGQAD